jgi:hypothetical protein
MQIGYFLSSEEWRPGGLVARATESMTVTTALEAYRDHVLPRFA